MMRVLDLFSGIGGFSLGLERTGGFRTVAFCEIDPYCRAVLKKHWLGVPCYQDVRTIPRIGCDVVTGGFPCQPWSHAGKQRGSSDDRHLWPAMLGVIRVERPTWVVGENVVGLINMGLDTVLSDLEAEGYSSRTFAIPASAVNAKHRRERIWIVAHADRKGLEGRHRGVLQERAGEQLTRAGCSLPDSDHQVQSDVPVDGIQGICVQGLTSDGGYAWLPEPGVGRVAHGIPSRVDRLRALGNAVVPQIPFIIGQAILEAEREWRR